MSNDSLDNLRIQRNKRETLRSMVKETGIDDTPDVVTFVGTILQKRIQFGRLLRVTLAGSIRRCKENPHDVDLMIELPFDPDVAQIDKDAIRRWFLEHGATPIIIQKGKTQLRYEFMGVQIDIYFHNPDQYGSMLLFLTGSAGYNIGLRRVAQKQGMLLSQWGLFKEGKLIASKTEEEIYNALGKAWKEPKDRN